MMMNNMLRRTALLSSPLRFGFATGATFLKMVESFFDRAAIHTGIRTDRLNFYKKAENVVKCSIPLVRGKFDLTKMTVPLKLSQPIVASTRHTSSLPKVALVTLRTLISKRLKLWLA